MQRSPEQFGGAWKERFKVRDGEVRLPGFDEVTDLPDDGSLLPEQRQIFAKAVDQFNAVVLIDKNKTGNSSHIRQALARTSKALLLAKIFTSWPNPISTRVTV